MYEITVEETYQRGPTYCIHRNGGWLRVLNDIDAVTEEVNGIIKDVRCNYNVLNVEKTRTDKSVRVVITFQRPKKIGMLQRKVEVKRVFEGMLVPFDLI